MRLILLKKLLLKFLHINVIPSQAVPFRSNAPLEAFLPSLEALLEVFICEVPQFVGYSFLNVVGCLKVTFL